MCYCVFSTAWFLSDAQDHEFLRGQVPGQGERADAAAARALRQQQQRWQSVARDRRTTLHHLTSLTDRLTDRTTG